MTYYILNFAITAFLATSDISSSEDKPKISLVPSVSISEETRVKELRDHIRNMTQNNVVVIKHLDELIQELNVAHVTEKSLTQNDVSKIYAAIEFAAEKHKTQKRKNKDKTPYISHPLGVTYNLMHFGGVRDPAMIIGSLLHDTVSEGNTTFQEIENTFGKEVADYVNELTEDKSLTRTALRRAQLIAAPKKSSGATQIKLADHLYNVVDLLNNPPDAWTEGRIDRYYQWIQSLVDRLPAANEKLKKAVLEKIDSYWKQHEKEKSSKA